MAVHYIIDGYNVLKKAAPLADKQIEEGRAELVRLIENRRPQGSLNNAVTVVFDGSPGRAPVLESSQVQVFFTYEESADDKIKRLVQESSSKRLLIVVTDDREIQYFVKSLGAQILATDDFLARLKPRRSGEARSDADGKAMDQTLAAQINQELISLWVNKRKRL